MTIRISTLTRAVVLLTAVAVVWAFFRELPKGNQMAAVKKAQGVLTGLRTELTAPPPVGS